MRDWKKLTILPEVIVTILLMIISLIYALSYAIRLGVDNRQKK